MRLSLIPDWILFLLFLLVVTSHSQGVHIEFPIHFRYQAPSESEWYRPASVVAPEFFIYCPKNRPPHPQTAVENGREADIQASAQRQGNIHNERYFQVQMLSEKITSLKWLLK